ncbi:MAG: DNA methylase [Eubacteriales bacterium]|nr:DNA methylase [Eubacteriales bacterium]
MEKTYVAIDLKSFYASVECVDRGLDPLAANLVVADASRTEKTICLAVSPSLKSYGIPGRARLFEVVQRVKEINRQRSRKAPEGFRGKSIYPSELEKDPSLELDYVVAPPRMAHYMEVSSSIYAIYLRYVAPEDIHVYSIDEVFIDATAYLETYRLTARDFAMMLIQEVLRTTGITATAGIGPNLYLCKIAMDIEAKHIPADKDGVRIAELTERSYREKLWDHTPLTDFWRVGRGITRKLEQHGMHTMGDVAAMSVENEDLLYDLFGINAELLIDHAWGWEPCTMASIKAYKPEANSISSGQVLAEPYDYDKGLLIVKEMTDLLVLELLDKGLKTDHITLTVGYDIDNLKDPVRRRNYRGPVTTDWYGRAVPKAAHGSAPLPGYTDSASVISSAMEGLYAGIVSKDLLVRRMYVVADRVVRAEDVPKDDGPEQLDLFTDYGALEKEKLEQDARLEKERSRQEAVLEIKKKFGRNAILKGMNLQEGATAAQRNGMVGGHKA